MFDERDLMLQAYVFAQHSPDPSTQNAALLITPNNGEIIIAALNCIPDKLKHLQDKLYSSPDMRPEKYDHTIHAEVNAICAAGVNGIRTKGLIMFCPWACCKTCAITIIGAGIAELWVHNLAEAHNQWSDDVKKGMYLIREAGIPLHIIDGKLDPDNEIKIRRNYIVYSP